MAQQTFSPINSGNGPTTIQYQDHTTPSAHPHSHLSASPLYRISTLFHSRPDLTESEFYNHWYTVHGPLCAPWALHYNIVEYTQYHTPLALREALSSGRDGEFKTGSPFEACADFYVKDYKDYLAAFRDPYYLEVVKKDEDNFVDKGQVAQGARGGIKGGSAAVAEKESVGGGSGSARAISAMGVCRSVIRDGKAVVDVPEQVLRVWEEYQARKTTRG